MARDTSSDLTLGLGAQADEPSYGWAVVVAFIALALFVGLLAVQGLEWAFYNAPPSVFPL